MDRQFWTFPLPGDDSVVVTQPHRDSFLFLNPTAAFIWKHQSNPDLPSIYAAQFGLDPRQAEADVAQTLAGWAQPNPSELTLRIDQTRFQVAFESQTLADEVAPRVQALVQSLQGRVDYRLRLYESAQGFRLEKEGELIATEPLVSGIRLQLLQELTRLAAPDRDFSAILHAAVCGTTEECLILAGPSFAGKSTLSQALVEAGWLCYSDDSACLTTEFEVAGMPFALAMRDGVRFRPSNLKGHSPCVRAAALVFIRYQAAAAPPRLAPLSPFEALHRFQQSGFWINHTQAAITGFLAWLGELPIYDVVYPEHSAALPLLKALLSSVK